MYICYLHRINIHNMNIKELSKLVAKETGLPAYKINKIICTTISVIRREVVRSQIVKLSNLLTIFADVAPKTSYYNINKKEVVEIPRRFVLKIIPSNLLKKEINEKKTY